MDAARLMGMAVVALAEGSKLGRVADLLFDPRALQLAALQVKSDDQTFMVPFEQVKHVGTDAVTVESSQVLQAAARGGAFGSLVDVGTLKRLKVVDESGTLLGTVHQLEVDQTTGRVLGMMVHKGGILGLRRTTTSIDAAAVRSIGADVITVTPVEEPPAPHPE